MRPLLLVYATREGQTRRIAEHISEYLDARAVRTAVCDLSKLDQAAPVYFSDYEAVIIAASVHNRRHEPEAIAFAKRQAEDLNEIPSMVLSVSSAQILAEQSRSRVLRALGAMGADRLLAAFLTETGLHPRYAHSLAGALAFTRYSRATRRAFQLFALLAGPSVDAHHNHAYTDFAAVDQYLEVLLASLTSDVPSDWPCGKERSATSPAVPSDPARSARSTLRVGA